MTHSLFVIYPSWFLITRIAPMLRIFDFKTCEFFIRKPSRSGIYLHQGALMGWIISNCFISNTKHIYIFSNIILCKHFYLVVCIRLLQGFLSYNSVRIPTFTEGFSTKTVLNFSLFYNYLFIKHLLQPCASHACVVVIYGSNFLH